MRKFVSLDPSMTFRKLGRQRHGDLPVVKVTERNREITISYTFPGFFRVPDSREIRERAFEFEQINMTQTGYLAEAGKPLLPAITRYVQIPRNTAYKCMGGAVTEEERFDEVLVLPAQEGMPDTVESRKKYQFNRDFYSQDTLYPDHLVEVTGPFEIDEYRALLVRVCPFQYNPGKRQLFAYAEIVVTITVTPHHGRVSPAPLAVSKEAYGNLFLNPRRAIEYRLGVSPNKMMADLRGPEFLIIHAPTLVSAAKKLAAWKNRRGLTTRTVSIETIGNESTKIKAFVRKQRRAVGSRLRYVLLLGHVDTIVSECAVVSEHLDRVGTDYYYSTPEDLAPDGFKPVLPWLSIGRIPVRTEEDAEAVVDKIIAFEKEPPSDPSYYRGMVVAAYFGGDPVSETDERGYLKSVEDIRTFMVSLGFEVQRVYTKDIANPKLYRNGVRIPDGALAAFIPEDEATNRLINAASKGKLLIAHRGHGTERGWAGPTFTIAELETVQGNMPSVFFSINCLTGQFYRRDLNRCAQEKTFETKGPCARLKECITPSECFAEKSLRMRGTAPSLIASTDETDHWLNNDLIRALFDALFGGLIPTFPGKTASYPMKFSRLGDLLNYAKCYLPTVSSDTKEIRNFLCCYEVIGDPTLEIWKDVPRWVAIKAVIDFRMLDVQLTECPRGSVITIWHGERILKRLEPSSTHFTLSTQDLGRSAASSVYPVTVCFWAPGYRYSEVEASRMV